MKKEILNAGDFVKCIDRTEENHENLQLGKVYEVVGANIINGDAVYALQDEAGNMYYSINRFEKVGHIATPTFRTSDELIEELKNTKCVTLPEPCKVDMVNQPNHYTFGGIETIDFLEAKLGVDGFRGWLKGNILKYMARATVKGNELEDYKKAQFYINKLVNTFGEESESRDTATHRPVTHKQRIYVASLTSKLDLDRLNLPEYLSPKKDYHDLTEAECAVLIGKLVALRDYLEQTDL